LQFRYRGSRRESAVAQLFSLGHIRAMKIIRLILISLICFNLCGCLTQDTIQRARGYPEKNEAGKSVPTHTPNAATYWLVPLTIPVDIITSPVQLFIYVMMKGQGPC
jgi:hypothetical protein